MTVPETEIIIRKDGAEVERRVVAAGEYIIGRGEDCAFQVIGEKVSRHHARLFVSYQDWSISGLGSANGTQLNEGPVGEAAVKVWPSQVVRIGDATIELRAISPSEPDATLMPMQETVHRETGVGEKFEKLRTFIVRLFLFSRLTRCPRFAVLAVLT